MSQKKYLIEVEHVIEENDKYQKNVVDEEQRYFLVDVEIILGRDDKYSLYQKYVVNEEQLLQIKKLDYENEGACCGQMCCLECNGIRIVYADHIEITDVKNSKKIIKFIGEGYGCFTLKKLLNNYIDSDDDSE